MKSSAGSPAARLLIAASLLFSLPGCVATAVVGGGSAAGSAAFDERSVGSHLDDVAIATRIDSRLVAEKDMPSRWVSVEVIEGEVTLTGYLPSQAHIDRAVYIARGVRGVRKVHSELHIGEPATSELFSDSLITTKVKSKLLDDPHVSGFSVHVETVSGKVYLQGVVKDDAERYRAKDLTSSVDGVTAVIDLLRVRSRQ